MMYFHAHYFFVTYHTASIAVIRRARHATRRLEALARLSETASATPQYSSTWFGVFYSSVAWALAMLPYAGTAIAFAWLEIYATSKPTFSCVLTILNRACVRAPPYA